jgi:hypothetical protein
MASDATRAWTHESTAADSVEWYTPPFIFHALGLEFDLDPASPMSGPLPWIPAKRHYTMRENGLLQPWRGRVWLNPPYGPGTAEWLKKADQHRNGVALVFARSDTEWFHRYAVNADAMLFVKGRVQFVDKTGRAGGPGSTTGSLMLAWGGPCVRALANSGLGFVVLIGE